MYCAFKFVLLFLLLLLLLSSLSLLLFTAKIDSENHNGDEINVRLLADRLYSCSSRLAGKYTEIKNSRLT